MMNTIYDQFIEYLKNEERKGFQSQESLDLEKHHILPLHAGGEKNGLLCSSRNHTLALPLLNISGTWGFCCFYNALESKTGRK